MIKNEIYPYHLIDIANNYKFILCMNLVGRNIVISKERPFINISDQENTKILCKTKKDLKRVLIHENFVFFGKIIKLNDEKLEKWMDEEHEEPIKFSFHNKERDTKLSCVVLNTKYHLNRISSICNIWESGSVFGFNLKPSESYTISYMTYEYIYHKFLERNSVIKVFQDSIGCITNKKDIEERLLNKFDIEFNIDGEKYIEKRIELLKQIKNKLNNKFILDKDEDKDNEKDESSYEYFSQHGFYINEDEIINSDKYLYIGIFIINHAKISTFSNEKLDKFYKSLLIKESQNSKLADNLDNSSKEIDIQLEKYKNKRMYELTEEEKDDMFKLMFKKEGMELITSSDSDSNDSN